MHCDSVYDNDSASLKAHLAGLLCHDPAKTAANRLPVATYAAM